MSPIDHGFCKSIYFAVPESLSVEVSCGTNIDGNAWIDPEVVELCGISEQELHVLKAPRPCHPPAEPVPQPPMDTTAPRMHLSPEQYELLLGSSDEKVWDLMSEPTPPVVVEAPAIAVNEYKNNLAEVRCRQGHRVHPGMPDGPHTHFAG